MAWCFLRVRCACVSLLSLNPKCLSKEAVPPLLSDHKEIPWPVRRTHSGLGDDS